MSPPRRPPSPPQPGTQTTLKRVETFCDEFVGFTRVTDEFGHSGWGQVSPYHADISVEVLHRQVAPWTLGKTITDLDDHLYWVQEREYKFPGSYLCRAIGGLETAIWDLHAKQAGLPVVALLGGSPGKLRVYGSSMRRDITPKDEVNRFARLRQEFGFDAFKYRIGSEVGRGRDEWEGRTEALIQTMYKALGHEQVALLADANSCYAPDAAIHYGRMLEDHGVTHYEEPCPHWELEQTRRVTEALEIDVTGGEQECLFTTWRRMIEMRAVDVLQPDILYLGGIGRLLRVAAMAEQAGFPVTPHSANLTMVTLFTMHVLRALPNAGPYLELCIEGSDYFPWQDNLFVYDPYRVSEGMVEVSDAPGWGVEVNPDWLARSKYQRSEVA